MNIILFDDPLIRTHLLPVTFTRPISEIRCGIMTITEKWKHLTDGNFSFLTEDYLSTKYPARIEASNILVNAAVCPDKDIWDAISGLASGEALYSSGQLLAGRIDGVDNIKYPIELNWKISRDFEGSVVFVDRTWKIFIENGAQIRSDFSLLTEGKTSSRIDDPNTSVYNQDHIFIEGTPNIKAAILNAEDGPIYIGDNVEIQEGSMLRGPLAVGSNSTIQMGAKIRQDTTIGPFCKVGGEVSNVVIMGFSNKAHDGFLGNAVIGEWCNLGADTNNSNLKNNYAEVRLWNYHLQTFENTGLQFCGLIMGDHSKCGINTMFNTGTVVGVGSNIFGAGFPRNFVPSFAWGGAAGFDEYRLDKFLDVVEKVLQRRNHDLGSTERDLLTAVYERTKSNRNF